MGVWGGRMLDSKCRVVITADGVMRGPKLIPLLDICDEVMPQSRRESRLESRPESRLELAGSCYLCLEMCRCRQV